MRTAKETIDYIRSFMPKDPIHLNKFGSPVWREFEPLADTLDDGPTPYIDLMEDSDGWTLLVVQSGVFEWVCESERATMSYCEGCVSLVVCATDDEYNKWIAFLDDFYLYQ